jgi:hypothetical protein
MTAALLAAHAAGAVSFLIWVIVALLVIACIVWVASLILPPPAPAVLGLVLVVLFLLWLIA